jgi:hypothetical protein
VGPHHGAQRREACAGHAERRRRAQLHGSCGDGELAAAEPLEVALHNGVIANKYTGTDWRWRAHRAGGTTFSGPRRIDTQLCIDR